MAAPFVTLEHQLDPGSFALLDATAERLDQRLDNRVVAADRPSLMANVRAKRQTPACRRLSAWAKG